ncbi:hypothetical protein HDU92_003672 [Lobulomyces angularis]|nr:hypothetical protein HDU92_003672 [Lobulomyces angularis]
MMMQDTSVIESEVRLLIAEEDGDKINKDSVKDIPSEPKKKKVAPRCEYFDGLRGYAAFQVYAAHELKYCFGHFIKPNFLIDLINNVLIGRGYQVPMFFVLSGRLISISLLKRPTKENFSSVCIRRFFRLAVPLFGAFLIYWVMGSLNLYKPIRKLSHEKKKNFYLNPEFPDSGFELNGNSNIYSVFKHTFDLFTWHLFGTMSHTVTWTIYIEFFNSYVIYVLVFLTSQINGRIKFIFYAILQYYTLCRFELSPKGTHISPISNLGYFVGGLIIAELSLAGFFNYINSRRWWWLLHFAAGIIPIFVLIPGLNTAMENFLNRTIFHKLIFTSSDVPLSKFDYKFMCDLYR